MLVLILTKECKHIFTDETTTYMSSNLLNLSLLALDLDLLSIDSSVLLVDIAGKLAVLGLEPIKGRLNMCKLLAQLFLLLAHAFIVHLHLTLQRLQLHIEVRALQKRTECHGTILFFMALSTVRQYLP